MQNSWVAKIVAYCRDYDIPIDYLTNVISEPKVIPMIRGKAFEFSVMVSLSEILPSDEWFVDKPILNPQFGSHDMDVRVLHKPTDKVIRVECKLAKKESLKKLSDGSYTIRVKCMRSRTLGRARAEGLAPQIGVPVDVLMVHNDQYVAQDFDVLITSIGNAFYRTNQTTELFEWNPSEIEIEFLEKLARDRAETDWQAFAFKQMYAAKSHDLVIKPENGITCTRRKCKNKTNCNFIPNFPIITFDAQTLQPDNRWIAVEQIEESLKEVLECSSSTVLDRTELKETQLHLWSVDT